MAEVPEQEEELELAESGGGGRKRLVIVIGIVLVLVLAGGGAGIYFSGMLSGGDETAATGEEGATAKPPRPAIYVTLDPPFTVNLKGESRAKYLQIAMQVLTRDPAVEQAIKNHGPVIRNNLVLLLGDKTSQDLADRKGKERLQQEIVNSIRGVVEEATGKAGVEDVLFTTFVMQ
ncbi:MAG: flagellar basal body-associated FliL family protein [Gammaproteobacteria bacterium]|nr:flagellar basal body-associated FliL family protein [Gammaproteobacteria bacterium]